MKTRILTSATPGPVALKARLRHDGFALTRTSAGHSGLAPADFVGVLDSGGPLPTSSDRLNGNSAWRKVEMPIIPKLESARLTLREHRRDDLSRAFLLWSASDVVRFIGGKPNSKPQCWSRLLGYRGHWALMNFGYWAVEEKSSGLYIGDVGFADFRRELNPSFDGAPELGWALMPSHHGQGFATEAVGVALAWGAQNLPAIAGHTRSVCMIDPLNLPSHRVAEKVGYREYARTKFADADTILFERQF